MRKKKHNARIFNPYTGSSASFRSHKPKEEYRRELRQIAAIEGIQVIILLVLAAVGIGSVIISNLLR